MIVFHLFLYVISQALGSEVTLIEGVDTLMPTFDPEIRRLADRLLIKPRAIDSRVGVFASEVIPGIPGMLCTNMYVLCYIEVD